MWCEVGWNGRTRTLFSIKGRDDANAKNRINLNLALFVRVLIFYSAVDANIANVPKLLHNYACLAMLLKLYLYNFSFTFTGSIRLSTFRNSLFVCSAKLSVRIVCGSIRARCAKKPL